MNAIRRILRWDEALFLYICRWQRPWCTRVMRMFTNLGNASTWFFVALCLYVLHIPETTKIALLIGAGGGFSAIIAHVVKRVSRRRRPDVGIENFQALAMNPDAFSFPSGHTAAAFGVAVAMMGNALGLAPLFAGFALCVAFSRVYLGAHYPLDVGAGAFIGIATGVAVQIWYLPTI